MKTRYLRARIGCLLLMLMIVLIFAVQNAALIDIQILRWQFELRRSVLIATVLGIGIVLGWSSRIIYRLLKS